jgi:hypothetical protein
MERKRFIINVSKDIIISQQMMASVRDKLILQYRNTYGNKPENFHLDIIDNLDNTFGVELISYSLDLPIINKYTR